MGDNYCTKGVCAAEDGHKGSCADASGWGVKETEEMLLHTLAELREARRAYADVYASRHEALATIDRIKAADPDLFDPDENAEDKVYETYGSNGRYLREDLLAAIEGKE